MNAVNFFQLSGVDMVSKTSCAENVVRYLGTEQLDWEYSPVATRVHHILQIHCLILVEDSSHVRELEGLQWVSAIPHLRWCQCDDPSTAIFLHVSEHGPVDGQCGHFGGSTGST